MRGLGEVTSITVYESENARTNLREERRCVILPRWQFFALVKKF